MIKLLNKLDFTCFCIRIKFYIINERLYIINYFIWIDRIYEEIYDRKNFIIAFTIEHGKIRLVLLIVIKR